MIPHERNAVVMSMSLSLSCRAAMSSRYRCRLRLRRRYRRRRWDALGSESCVQPALFSFYFGTLTGLAVIK